VILFDIEGLALAIHSLRFVKIFPTFPSYMLASGESDGEFQDSIEQQVSEDAINDIPDNSDEIQDLERELQRLKTERRSGHT
jgi:hypothetical protein